jgi:hypothetical protein
MEISITTEAEKQAELAEKYKAFSGIKLLHIKRQVAELIALIGRDGFFATYTKHDITHIEEMLKILDWLLPSETKAVMSPADWMLIVLAIYFHDAGMIVTQHEFDKRSQSDFEAFKRKLLGKPEAGDYRLKIEKLGADAAERFLYEEYVRDNHPSRIRAWIEGKANVPLGANLPVMAEINNLVSKFPTTFRSDLALVCESHHLGDLDDFSKYPTSRAYGNSKEETANVQFCAIMLRTADLLHITRDRTPSVMFNAIAIADPISQLEWAKQNAVRCVRARVERDENGHKNEDIPKQTIEVQATFDAAEGFFGLTTYLSYVASEIKQSFDWAEKANKSEGAQQRFPWKKIDDTGIVARGFLAQPFEFTLDQGRILDLLTGHTLYNDSTVAIRELTQNALDAVRLQHHIELRKNPNAKIGAIRVHFDSETRELTVQDEGTGMTQDIIEKHFLKVGSSRYQDPAFLKEFPSYFAISRFGIGVLSAFMISDEVTVTTSNADEPEARNLTLKSVHGRYLIRLLDKDEAVRFGKLPAHGTIIKLRLRASSKTPDVLNIMRSWIVFPDCNVSVTIDNRPAEKIGFDNPRSALEAAIKAIPYAGTWQAPKWEVKEVTRNGITLAYGVVWSDTFKEWSFYQVPGFSSPEVANRVMWGLGTCIGGVRVERTTPGFQDLRIAAILNATGDKAPRTNVARSQIDATDQWDSALKEIYKSICEHVTSEMARMQSEDSRSLTWAVLEAPYIINPIARDAGVTNPALLTEEISRLPALLVESEGRRKAISAAELDQEQHFWTVDSDFVNHAEWLIREVKADASLSNLIKSLGVEEFNLPETPVLCGASPSNILAANVLRRREVDILHFRAEQRRVDLRWVAREASDPRWARHSTGESPSGQRIHAVTIVQQTFGLQPQNTPFQILVKRRDVKINGGDSYDAVAVRDSTFLFGSPVLITTLCKLIDGFDKDNSEQAFQDALIALVVVGLTLQSVEPLNVQNAVAQIEERAQVRRSGTFPLSALVSNLAPGLRKFNVRERSRI